MSVLFHKLRQRFSVDVKQTLKQRVNYIHIVFSRTNYVKKIKSHIYCLKFVTLSQKWSTAYKINNIININYYNVTYNVHLKKTCCASLSTF